MTRSVRQVATLARRIGSDEVQDQVLLDRFRRFYGELPRDSRPEFFRWLAGELEVGRSQIEEPMARVRAASEKDRAGWNERVRELRRSIASPRQRLLEGLINTTGGMQFILELRAQVLDAQRNS
jgi:Malonyl-CoA decarboxylase N-terminal domain